MGRLQASISIEPGFEAFLDGRDGPSEVRPEILASWRRSWLSGVSPETDLADVPFDLEFDRENRLLRAARPVLDHLAETLSDTTTSILLTDAAARILDRWVGDESLHAMLDRVSAAPGAVYNETAAGTNGLGTAAEERRVARVLGPDHFVDALRSFTCVGVPLRHPVTGRVEGVLDITCRYQDTNDLLLPTIVEGARSVQQQLLEQASRRERHLLEHFLRAKRGGGRAVVCLNEDVTIANSAARRLLAPADYAVLWERATRALAGGDPVVEVPLNGAEERLVAVRYRSVRDEEGIVGLVLEIDDRPGESRPPSAELPEGLRTRHLVGRGEAYRRLCSEVVEHAGHRLPLLVTGEAGTGKLSVARAVHHCAPAGGRLATLDAGLCAVRGAKAWLGEASRAVSSAPGGTLLIPHVELLDRTTLQALWAVLEATSGCSDEPPRVVATLSDDERSDDLARLLLPRFPARIHVPPLRERREDIPLLLQAFLRRHDDSATVRATPEVVSILMQLDWPGNVRELESLACAVLHRRRRGELCGDDLPPAYRRAAALKPLTRLEQVERDAILSALKATGSKAQAAESLGISRSSLYRKMATYRIAFSELA